VGRPEPEKHPAGWQPSAETVTAARAVYADALPPVNLVGLTRWLTARLQQGMSDEDVHCRVYGDALYEISRLIGELRFEVALAALYITEFGDKPAPGGAHPHVPRRPFEVPGTAITLISPPLDDAFLLSQLFANPGSPIAGHRTVAGWLAAQLLDSARLRAEAALDCVAVLLWCAAAEPLRSDHAGQVILPTFCVRDLERVGPRYRSLPAWPSLCQLAERQCARGWSTRGAFIHQRRLPVQLHGGREAVVRFGGDRAAPTVNAKRQLAMTVNFGRGVLGPAIAYTDEILSQSPQRLSASAPVRRAKSR
jgi:hypothetical protein